MIRESINILLILCVVLCSSGEGVVDTLFIAPAFKSDNRIPAGSLLSAVSRPHVLANIFQTKNIHRKLIEGEEPKVEPSAPSIGSTPAAPEWAMDETEINTPTKGTSGDSNAKESKKDSPTNSGSIVSSNTPTLSPTTQSTNNDASTTKTSTNAEEDDDDDENGNTETAATTKTASPSIKPSTVPSIAASVTPSVAPSVAPSTSNTITPTIAPTASPTLTPSATPSVVPSTAVENIDHQDEATEAIPTEAPTKRPKKHKPTAAPTNTDSVPTESGSDTASSTTTTSTLPTINPTQSPTYPDPTASPSAPPSVHVEDLPPTPHPTSKSKHRKTATPTEPPVEFIEIDNNDPPTASKDKEQSKTSIPTESPSAVPSLTPTTQATPIPSLHPTKSVIDSGSNQEFNGEVIEEEESTGFSASSVFIVAMGIMGMYAIYRFVYGPRNDSQNSSGGSQSYTPVPIYDEDRGDLEMNNTVSKTSAQGPVDWEEWDLEEDDDVKPPVVPSKGPVTAVHSSTSSNKLATESFQQQPLASSRNSSKNSSSSSLKEKDSGMKVSTSRPRTPIDTRNSDEIHQHNKSTTYPSVSTSDSLHTSNSFIHSPVPTLPKPPSSTLSVPVVEEAPLISFDHEIPSSSITNQASRSVPQSTTAPVATAPAKKSRNIQPRNDDDIFASIGLSAAPKAKPAQQVPDLDSIFAQHSSKKPTQSKPAPPLVNASNKSSNPPKSSSRTKFEEDDVGISAKWDEDKELDALMDLDD